MQSQNRGIIWISILFVIAIIITLFISPKSQTQNSELEIIGDQSIIDTTNQRITFHAKPRKIYYPPSAVKHDTVSPRIQYTPYHRQPLTIEINTADTTDFKQLKGIGSTFAKRIVSYRNLLGGFIRTEQLLEVYGFTDSLYLQILPHLVINVDSIDQIPINDVSLDQLKKHPYLDYYQAKAIIKYRNQGNNIHSMEDLYNIALLDQETITRINPYIKY